MTCLPLLTPIKKDRRHRGTHSTCCKQPHPFYWRPTTYRSAPGEIGRAFRNFVGKNKNGTPFLRRRASCDPVFVLLEKKLGRQRGFRVEKMRLIDALFPLLASKADLATWICNASVSRLADELSPKDEAGDVVFETRVEVSRVSRLLHELHRFGVVEIPESQFDKEYGCFMPKYVLLTARFWEMTGVNMDKLRQERAARIEAIEEGILHPGSEMSVKRARQRFLAEKHWAVFKYRRKQIRNAKQQKKYANKDIDERKVGIARHLRNTLPVALFLTMNKEMFEKRVWNALYECEMGIDHPPPNHDPKPKD